MALLTDWLNADTWDVVKDKFSAMLDVVNGTGGGTAGQVLTKSSGTDFDYDWVSPPTLGLQGGTTDQILTKASNDDYDFQWVSPFSDTWHTVGDVDEPDYENSWDTLDDPVMFTKTSSGQIMINGKITGGTFAAIDTPETLFTLPVDYRPDVTRYGSASKCLIAGAPTRPSGYIQVLDTGEVQISSSVSGSPTEFHINMIF